MSPREKMARALGDAWTTAPMQGAAIWPIMADAALAVARELVKEAEKPKPPSMLTVEGGAIWLMGERDARAAARRALGGEP